MQKFIVIGVGKFDVNEDIALDGEDFFAVNELEALDFVDDKTIEVSIAFKEAGLVPFEGNPLVNPPYVELHKALKEARGRTASGSVIHYIGHGIADSELGALHLPASDTDLEELGDTSIEVGGLINAIESNQRSPHVLLLLDVCNAGEATRIQALNLLPSKRRKTWVIGASTRSENAFKARFSEAVTVTLQRLKGGWLDIHPSLEYVPMETMASEISLALTKICAKDRSTLPQSLTVTPRTELNEDCPPFFENPSYQITPQARLLMRAEAEVREFAAQLDEGLDAIHFATRATGIPHQSKMSGRCFFAGREAQLADLSQWMDEGRGSSLRVVTGSPGAGKSALIGVLVCLSHPDLHDATPSVASKIPTHLQPSYNESIAAVHARGRDLDQILNSIARQLNIPRPEDGELTSAHLIQEILAADSNPVIIVDALDEAVRPVDVMSNLLLPLSIARGTQRESACRVLVGTRPWSQFDVLLKAADRNNGLIDLDSIPSATVEKDLKQYIVDLLRDQPSYRGVQKRKSVQEIAGSVARLLSHRDVVGAFLIAGLFVHQIGTDLSDNTVDEICAVAPRSLPQMLELHLGQLKDQSRRWMRPIMAALAYAKGEGMPATVIQAASVAFTSEVDMAAGPNDREVAEVLAATSFYLRHSIDEDGRTLYRLFHQALADHLLNYPIDPGRRTSDKTSNALGIFQALRSLVGHPNDQSGIFQRNLWKTAPAYLIRHAIQHALDGGGVDSLLLDSEFLVYSDPSNLLQLLGYARSTEARLAAAVYRTSSTRHSQLSPPVRRNILSLDACRYGAEKLLSSLQTKEEIASEPYVHFVGATGGELKESFLHDFAGHTGAVTALTAASIRGNMTILSASEDGSLRVSDMRGGWTLEHLVTAHTDWILALSSITVNGNPTVVTAGVDNQVMGWDFSSAHAEPFLIGQHQDWVRAIAVHEMDERSIVVSAGDDHELRVWDLATREMIGDPLVGHMGSIYSLAIGRIGGSSLAVSSSRDGEVIVWDLSTRQIVKRFIPFQADWVRGIAIPDGRREAFLASDGGQVGIWDLSGFEEIRRSSGSPAGGIRDMDTAVVGGESVAVTCGIDGAMMMWNRDTTPVPFPYAFRGFKPRTLSTSSVEGRPLALIGGINGLVLTLNLDSDEDLGSPWVREVDDDDAWMMDNALEGVLYAAAIGYVDGKPIVYTGDNAGTVSRWTFGSPSESDKPVHPHGRDVFRIQAVPHHSGDLLITSSAHGAIFICELSTGSPIHTLARGKGSSGTLRHFAVQRLSDHVRIIVGTSGELTIWDARNPTSPSERLQDFRDAVTAVAVVEFGENATCVTGHAHGAIRFWNLHTTELTTIKPRAHKQNVWRLVNVDDPTNMRVASLSEDGAVSVWNSLSAEKVATYKLRDGRLTSVASVFTKSLNLIAIGYDDGTLDFLDPISGIKVTESVIFPFAVTAIDIDENGLMVACFSQQIAFMRLDVG
ncbi:hypothetical protein ABZV24_05685 [Streptomyces sp. NPDC005251]|uniref:hypothetical protein n=1 Tax=Streptomyces sp. NPDC005251 TaxID=3157166 RepID=UPI0033BC5366